MRAQFAPLIRYVAADKSPFHVALPIARHCCRVSPVRASGQ